MMQLLLPTVTTFWRSIKSDKVLNFKERHISFCHHDGKRKCSSIDLFLKIFKCVHKGFLRF